MYTYETHVHTYVCVCVYVESVNVLLRLLGRT